MIFTRTQPAGTTPRGFTLVELIVSIAIFMVVVVIALSAYVSLIALDRKARATSDIVSNLSFVMDNMSRSIRTGTQYDCGTGGADNCWPVGKHYFSFTNADCQPVTYLLKSDNTIGECIGTADLGGTCSPAQVSCTDSSATTLTDPRVQVTDLTFYAEGIGSGDQKQPRVIFSTTGSIKPDANTDPITFTIEGGATERLLDI